MHNRKFLEITCIVYVGLVIPTVLRKRLFFLEKITANHRCSLLICYYFKSICPSCMFPSDLSCMPFQTKLLNHDYTINIYEYHHFVACCSTHTYINCYLLPDIQKSNKLYMQKKDLRHALFHGGQVKSGISTPYVVV